MGLAVFFKGGANPEELTSKVMTALTSKVRGFVCNLDHSSVLDGTTNLLESFKGMARGAVEKANKEHKGFTSPATRRPARPMWSRKRAVRLRNCSETNQR